MDKKKETIEDAIGKLFFDLSNTEIELNSVRGNIYNALSNRELLEEKMFELEIKINEYRAKMMKRKKPQKETIFYVYEKDIADPEIKIKAYRRSFLDYFINHQLTEEKMMCDIKRRRDKLYTGNNKIKSISEKGEKT